MVGIIHAHQLDIFLGTFFQLYKNCVARHWFHNYCDRASLYFSRLVTGKVEGHDHKTIVPMPTGSARVLLEQGV